MVNMRMKQRSYGSSAVVIPALSLVLISGGCGGSSPQLTVDGTPQPYRAEFEQLRNDEASDFVRTVIIDETISPAEYKESRDGFGDCLKQVGIDPLVSTEDDGIIRIDIPSAAVDNPDYLTCEKQWDGGIGTLYESIVTNPDNIPWFDLVAACLVHEGFAPPGLTGEDVDKLYQKAGTKFETTEDGPDRAVAGPEDPDPVLPGGQKLFSEDTAECLSSPSRVLTGSGNQSPKTPPP